MHASPPRALALALALALAFVLGAAPAHADSPTEVEALVKQRDPSALARAEALVKANEGDAAAWIVLARAQLQKGQADDAIDSAEEAVELAPNDAQAHYWLGNSLGIRIQQVNMLRQMAMAPDLRDAFEAAVRLDPSLLDARQSLIQFYLQAPAAVGGGIDKARAQVAEIARRDAVRGHLAQISIDRFNKDDAAAARSLDAAVMAMRPDAPRETWLGVGMALQSFERWDAAKAHFERWAAQQPRQAAPHYQLGRLAAISGQFLDEGSAGLKRYLDDGLARAENDPNDTAAWWRLGQIQAKRGDASGARMAYQAALRLDPANVEAKKSLEAL